MISAIIPMYNSSDTIASAIESVLNQTYSEPLEVIVVNDGSTDGCEEIVQKIIDTNKTNRIIKLINKENGGVSSARNMGIKAAQSEWVAFLDSDDIWLPEKLEKQIEAIEKNPDIKFIGTNRNGEIYPFFNKSKKQLFTLNAKELLAKWYPHTSTVLIYNQLLDKTELYDESRTHAEDGDFFLKTCQFADLYVLNEDLVYTGAGKRTFGESGLSANMPKMFEGEALALKGALKRKQIGFFEYMAFYVWLFIKYLRRILIVKSEK